MMKLYSKGLVFVFLFFVVLGGCATSKVTSESKEDKVTVVNPDDYLPGRVNCLQHN